MPWRVKQSAEDVRQYFVCWAWRWPRGSYRTLEDLEVLQICVLGVHIELDSGHWDIEVDTIEDLAESRTRRGVSKA